MLRPTTALLIVLTTASLLGAACQPLPPGLSTRPLSAQGYPQPGPTTPPPSPTATPSADAGAYLPPPAEPVAETVRLADGPYADVLVGLQAALEGGDSTWISARIADNRPLRMFDIRQLDSEGGTALDSDEAGGAAAAFFTAGSRPRIQAYFVEERHDTVCVYALTHRWQGDVPYPGVDDLGGAEPHGPQPPATVPLDAAALVLCREQLGTWTLHAWIHGGYYETIERLGLFRPQLRLTIVRP